MFNKKERERYNEDRERACNRLNITKNRYNWFRRKGQELHKIYEDNCNGIISEDVYFGKTKPLDLEIIKKAESLGLYVFFQTDSRGATIYLDTEAIPENNYTQAQVVY